jgi:hypothetical protein
MHPSQGKGPRQGEAGRGECGLRKVPRTKIGLSADVLSIDINMAWLPKVA